MAEQAARDRLHQALSNLRRSRRGQCSDHIPLENRFRTATMTAGVIMCFFGAGLEPFFPTDGDRLAALGILFTFGGMLTPFIYTIISTRGTSSSLAFRIPAVLFLETQVHLLELILIVALLGNGLGVVIGVLARETTVAAAVLLCVLWSIVVLGGAAWALWVAAALRIEDAYERYVLILAGVFAPAGVVSLFLGLGMFCFSLMVSISLESTIGAFISANIMLVSICLLCMVTDYHQQATSALRSKTRADRIRAEDTFTGPTVARATPVGREHAESCHG